MVEPSQKNNSSSDWNLYNDWDSPIPPDWIVFDTFLTAYAGLVKHQYTELNTLIKKWDHILSKLGKDPTHINWNNFRPLRLTREEDWSDWLAFLLKQSETGIFAHNLFNNSVSNKSEYAKPLRVEREVSHLGYRADLIIQWLDNHYSHIEIKIGDPNLQKTYATGKAMRNRYHQPITRWSNYILLLSNQISDWNDLTHQETDEPPITVLTWDEVAIALRRALQSNENMTWKAWACTFIGAIEQILIGYPGHLLTHRPVSNLEAKINILKKGIENE